MNTFGQTTPFLAGLLLPLAAVILLLRVRENKKRNVAALEEGAAFVNPPWLIRLVDEVFR